MCALTMRRMPKAAASRDSPSGSAMRERRGIPLRTAISTMVSTVGVAASEGAVWKGFLDAVAEGGATGDTAFGSGWNERETTHCTRIVISVASQRRHPEKRCRRCALPPHSNMRGMGPDIPIAAAGL